MDLPRLWEKANQEERRKLLLTMLDAVYVDAKKTKSIVAIKPKPPFKPVFQVAASRKYSNITYLKRASQRLIFISGGDGGGSNSPSRRSCPGHATSLVSSLILPDPPQLTELGQASR